MGEEKGSDVEGYHDQAKNRKMLADFCRSLGEQLTGRPAAPPPTEAAAAAAQSQLAPRVYQTLQRLLAGDSEKQIAARLKLSPHTVHVYIKTLYRHFEVNSRGELLARFVSAEFTEG